MINCPSCGGVLKYDIASAQMKCASCDSLFDPYIFDNVKEDAETEETYEARIYVCPGCGAELATADETDITSVCSYCGYPRIIFDRIENEKRPETIIPFRITKDVCKEKYLSHSRRAFLAPGDVKSPGVVESFRGIYMPYRTVRTKIHWKITQVLKGPSYVNGKYICTDIHKSITRFNNQFEDTSQDASEQFDDSISAALVPFNKEREKKFTPGYLCGFYAEAGDKPAEDRFAEAEDMLKETAVKAARKNKDTGFIVVKSDRSFPPHENKYEKKLYPVWFMSARKKNKLTYAAVNGSSGKIVADFPVSPVKFFIFAFLIAAVVFALMNFGNFLFMPKSALMITSSALLIAWSFCAARYAELVERGRMKEKRTGPINKKQRTAKAIALSIITAILLFIVAAATFLKSTEDTICFMIYLSAMTAAFFSGVKITRFDIAQSINLMAMAGVEIASICVLAFEPLNTAYYVLSFINSAVFAIQTFMTFRYHNMLAYRRPPQFNKKGGDDNA